MVIWCGTERISSKKKKLGTYVLSRNSNAMKNQRGDPWKSKFFLLRGVNEMGWRGVRSLLKPSSVFLINKKIKFENLFLDNT